MLTDFPVRQIALDENCIYIDSPSISPDRETLGGRLPLEGLKPQRSGHVASPEQLDQAIMPATTVTTTIGLLAIPAIIVMFFRCHVLQRSRGTASEHADW